MANKLVGTRLYDKLEDIRDPDTRATAARSIAEDSADEALRFAFTGDERNAGRAATKAAHASIVLYDMRQEEKYHSDS